MPPTTTGLPRSSGRARTATEAKNASMSTCRIVQPASSASGPKRGSRPRGTTWLRPTSATLAPPPDKNRRSTGDQQRHHHLGGGHRAVVGDQLADRGRL